MHMHVGQLQLRHQSLPERQFRVVGNIFEGLTTFFGFGYLETLRIVADDKTVDVSANLERALKTAAGELKGWS
jgi:hypothetical protein